MEEKKNENEMEEWKDVKKGQKTSPVAIIILVILLIAAVAAGLLFGDKLYSLVHPTEESKAKTEEKEKENTTEEETKENQQEETKAEEIKPLDLSKCLNCGEHWIISDPKETNTTDELVIQNENNQLSLYINWDKFCKTAGTVLGPGTCGAHDPYEIRGVNKTVKSTIVGGSGQSAAALTLYYLLEDGTVEYTKMFIQKETTSGTRYYALNYTDSETEKDANGNRLTYFASQGAVPNVSKVVKLYNVQAHVENGGGWATTIGALADGSFYDLKVE